MRFRGARFSDVAGLTVGAAVLLHCVLATAQRRGGGMPGGGGGGLSAYSRPDGVSEGDTLKDFHQALAVQATSQQVAVFQDVMKTTGAAKAELQSLEQSIAKGPAPVARDAALDQSIENARNATRKFQEGFSEAQKNGLREIEKRFVKADADLDQEQKRLSQALDAKAQAAEVAARADSLDQALTAFSAAQLALGREMSIVMASGQDLTFLLPQVKSPISRNNTTTVTVSGALSQVSAQDGRRKFNIELITDLSDLQQNITELMRARLDNSATCGERIAVQRATLMPDTPASVLNLQLHYERWSCSRMFGQQTSNELAEGDCSAEIRLTPSVEPPNALKVTVTFGLITPNGMIADSLRSGPLGDDIKEKVARAIVAAARPGLDFKIALPSAVQNVAVVQSAKFEDMGAGYLRIVLTGAMEISNEQADALATQLNQTLSAQGSAR